MNDDSIAQPVSYIAYTGGSAEEVTGQVVTEMLLTLYLDGQEWVTLVCSPTRLNALVLGFLLSEGLIGSLGDISLMRVCQEDGVADVRLTHPVSLPARRVLTTGCGGGTTFGDLTSAGVPLSSAMSLPYTQVPQLMSLMQKQAVAHETSGGIHTAALSDGQDLLLIAEDVGRHNTVDRLWGEALARGIDTRDKVILSSGRITSEMLRKAGRMGVPVIISRTSPSSLALRLAEDWGITLVGYAHGRQFRVYTHPQRITVTVRPS
jgi:FdhD protein